MSTEKVIYEIVFVPPTQKEMANIGVTPNSGGTTPRYRLQEDGQLLEDQKNAAESHPLGPSFAKAFLTTSIAPVYIPGCAVCSLVLVRSNG